MSAALHRSSPRELVERAVVWLLGFAATGYVFHDVDAATLRDIGLRELAQIAGSLLVVACGVAYFAFVVPRTYAVGFVLVIGYVAGLRALLPLVQWAGVRVIEARQ